MECMLDVKAMTSAELISTAGGWLCDRAMAGWSVTVWLPRVDHARSFAILGVTARVLTAGSDDGDGALLVSGAAQPDSVGDRATPVRHQVSAAGRAFKARALLAAGLPPDSGDLETFRLGGSGDRGSLSELAPRSVVAGAP
ncbi:hypothetical protein [Mycolicibacterium thermoresistibile]